MEELCFVTAGCVNLFTNDGVKFMALRVKAVFGDYAILHDLRSNISFKTTEGRSRSKDGSDDTDNTALMCITKDVFLRLCELYP